jgi:hypothetical protein
MIDIYCTGGSFIGVLLNIDMMDELMKDDIIKNEDFLPLKFDNGCCVRVRKRDICAYCEHFEEDTC